MVLCYLYLLIVELDTPNLLAISSFVYPLFFIVDINACLAGLSSLLALGVALFLRSSASIYLSMPESVLSETAPFCIASQDLSVTLIGVLLAPT